VNGRSPMSQLDGKRLPGLALSVSSLFEEE
jgi:hypothetical protein